MQLIITLRLYEIFACHTCFYYGTKRCNLSIISRMIHLFLSQEKPERKQDEIGRFSPTQIQTSKSNAKQINTKATRTVKSEECFSARLQQYRKSFRHKIHMKPDPTRVKSHLDKRRRKHGRSQVPPEHLFLMTSTRLKSRATFAIVN